MMHCPHLSSLITSEWYTVHTSVQYKQAQDSYINFSPLIINDTEKKGQDYSQKLHKAKPIDLSVTGTHF